MSFELRITPRANEDLASLRLPQRETLYKHLLRLADDPAGLSRRAASPPYPPGLMYQFHHWDDTGRCLLTVLFKYGSDEQSLEVIGTACQPLPCQQWTSVSLRITSVSSHRTNASC